MTAASLPVSLRASVEITQLPQEAREVLLAMHRLGVQGWMDAYLRAEKLLSDSVRRLGVKGFAHEAVLVQMAAGLQDDALRAVIQSPLSASTVIETSARLVMTALHEQYLKDVQTMVDKALVPLQQRLREEVAAELQAVHGSELNAVRAQFDMLERAATTAQAEASAAERRVRELEDELQKARFEVSKLSSRVRDGERLPEVEQALKDERAAHQTLRESVIVRERETRTLTRQVSTLQHDNHALRTQLAEAQAAPPSPETGYRLPRVVDALSFRAWLAAQGIEAHVEGQVCTPAPLPDAVLREWEAAHPDALSRRQQLGLRSAV